MEMNENIAEYTKEFLSEYKQTKEHFAECQKLFVRNCSSEFVSWFNKVMAIALKNVSKDNVDIFTKDFKNSLGNHNWLSSYQLVATKNGIRERYFYHNKKTEALSLQSILCMVKYKVQVKEWFKANSPDKESAFDELCLALENNPFNFDTGNGYKVSQPQHTISEFTIPFHKPVYVLNKDKLEKVIFSGIKVDLSYRDWFCFYIQTTDNNCNIRSDMYSAGAKEWDVFFWKDILPELNQVIDIFTDKIREKQKYFDSWISGIKDTLKSYSALLEL